MIEKGRQYVYRLKHKSGKFFHEAAFVSHNSEQTGVILSNAGDRIFTTPEQLGKLWSRVEAARVEMFQLENIMQNHSYGSPQGNAAANILNRYREAIQKMDDMEVDICELVPAPEDELKTILAQKAKLAQANMAFKARFGDVCAQGHNNAIELLLGFEQWLEMPNKEEWTHIIRLDKIQGETVQVILNKISQLGITGHTFDPEHQPRTFAAKEEDLNFINLTNKVLVRNSVEIAKALELKAQINAEFGLSEI